MSNIIQKYCPFSTLVDVPPAVPQSAIPLCIYDGREEGYTMKQKGYDNGVFCQNFQTTFNENGLCYTYNNLELSLDKVILDQRFFV
jgi:hypothetical protein